MELLIRSGASFEEDLSLLCAADRSALIARMNELFPEYLCNRDTFCTLLLTPDDGLLAGGFCSSLSMLPLAGSRTLVLTIDDDPIFDQVIITLIRLVPADQALRALREAHEALHCSPAGQGAPGGGG
jgi:hypothetical protein